MIAWATYQTPFEIVYSRPMPSLTTYEIGPTKNNEVEKELINKNESLAKVETELKRVQRE